MTNVAASKERMNIAEELRLSGTNPRLVLKMSGIFH